MIWAIHGFTSGPSMWEKLAEIPASQCLTVLGHGPSSVASGEETFASEVARLAELLPEEATHLVGYSLGARLALAIALAQPTRFQELSLIGVTPGLRDPAERQIRREADQAWIDQLRDEGMEPFAKAWQAQSLWDSQAHLPEPLRVLQHRRRLERDPEQLAFALQSLGTGAMTPMWQELGTLHMPVQLIVGDQDLKYTKLAEAMLPHLPQGTVHRIAGTGHNPVLEAPAAISALLAKTASRASVAL